VSYRLCLDNIETQDIDASHPILRWQMTVAAFGALTELKLAGRIADLEPRVGEAGAQGLNCNRLQISFKLSRRIKQMAALLLCWSLGYWAIPGHYKSSAWFRRIGDRHTSEHFRALGFLRRRHGFVASISRPLDTRPFRLLFLLLVIRNHAGIQIGPAVLSQQTEEPALGIVFQGNLLPSLFTTGSFSIFLSAFSWPGSATAVTLPSTYVKVAASTEPVSLF
jgi:hypothetical protein